MSATRGAGPSALDRTSGLRLSVETQRTAVTDSTRARIAIVRPILRATLFALANERVQRLGGHERVTLADLAREYREGDGDCGVCFEYAIHDAIRRQDPLVEPRVAEVLDDYCRLTGQVRSILFGAEKGKKLRLVETDAELLTDEARVLAGIRGQPAKLKPLMETLVKAHGSVRHRESLPPSIRGLWRADLFVGSLDRQRWVATTLKTNPDQLEGAAGIRLGIYGERTRGERPSFDGSRNLILCPVPYDGGFMELFYRTFYVVKTFLDADARVPRPVALPSSEDRHVATLLEERRGFAVLEIVAALERLAQPGLLESSSAGDPYSDLMTTAIAPIARAIEE